MRKKCKTKKSVSYDDTQKTDNAGDSAVSFHLSKRAKLEMNNNRLLHSSLGFSQLDLLGACEADHNYTSFNRIQTIFDSLDGPSSSSKKIKKTLQIQQVSTKEGCKGFTGVVNSSREWTVRMDSPSFLSYGLIGCTTNGVAVYQTAIHAVRATMVRCMVDGAMYYGGSLHPIPRWLSDKHLLEKGNFHVLKCELCGHLNCLFGVLTQGGCGIRLHIPSQYLPEDLDFRHCQWETFSFVSSSWKLIGKEPIASALTLFGKQVFKKSGKGVKYGKVVSFDRDSRQWTVKYKDGNSETMSVSDIVQVIR